MTDTPSPQTTEMVDWSASDLGNEVWNAWNALDSAIHRMMCAQPHQITERAEQVEMARDLMAMALRDRDRRKS